jgi:uncharacterized cupredoxin-like copper-binding protein
LVGGRLTRARVRGSAIAVAVVVASLGLTGCGDSRNVAVTFVEQEYNVEAIPPSLPSGSLAVDVKNNGAIVHELVALRTDLDESNLPLTADGTRVDETAAGITRIEPTADDVAPGKTVALTLDLAAGRYVFICNTPGHYTSGMHVAVTVA